MDLMIWICWVNPLNSCGSWLIILEVGNGKLTLEEQRTHFNLWALSKSPLLIGTHVCSLLNKVPKLISAASFDFSEITFDIAK